jgi:hypothetical protein
MTCSGGYVSFLVELIAFVDLPFSVRLLPKRRRRKRTMGTILLQIVFSLYEWKTTPSSEFDCRRKMILHDDYYYYPYYLFATTISVDVGYCGTSRPLVVVLVV